MKNKIILSLVIFASACNYLDFDETNSVTTVEDKYNYFSTTKTMLTHVYSGITGEFDMSTSAACDEAEFASTSNEAQRINDGTWSARNLYASKWTLYNYIRSANEFLVEIQNVDFSRYEAVADYVNSQKIQLQYFEPEARLLRAYYFFELAKRYGDIAMPLTTLSVDEANSISKTSFDDVIEFIVSECEYCMEDERLPVTFATVPSAEIGRVTRGFAMGLKSRALLYAASELHNSTGDKDKWLRAAQAAYDVIEYNSDNGGIYDLQTTQYPINNLSCKQVVLYRMFGVSNDYETRNFPLPYMYGSRTDLLAGVYPTQNLVDAFQTINGYSVTLDGTTWSSDDPSFSTSSPYANRDPRFDLSILAHGSSFKDSTIDVSKSGLDYNEVVNGGSPTGYFINKHIQSSVSFETGNVVNDSKHHWVLYRYAETLLTFAEALYEYLGSETATYSEFGDWTAVKAFDMIRDNYGMPLYAATPAYADVDFMTAIQMERMVEFAFESQRFWDIRRWKIGASASGDLYGVSVGGTSGLYTYEKVKYESRYWDDKMNLYPIPESELFANPSLAPQNYGW